jgi:hypothetical protein
LFGFNIKFFAKKTNKTKTTDADKNLWQKSTVGR